MKKYFSILFLGAILIFICSCHKDQPVPAPTSSNPYYLQKATLDYCYFKPGTWWLYQDSISGIKDSVYVTASADTYDTITKQDNLGYTGIFETFYVTTHGSYLNCKQNVYLSSTFSQNSNRDDSKYYREELISPAYIGTEERYFTTNFQTGFNQGPDTPVSLGFSDSSKVGNIWYKSVVSFYHPKNYSEHNARTYLFFSKKTGLIKKIIPDSNRVWLLINYNIVQ